MCAAAGRRREESARAQLQAVSAAPEALRRGEPDPGQVGARRDGHDRAGAAPATLAARREVPRDGARSAAGSGHRAPGLRVVQAGVDAQGAASHGRRCGRAAGCSWFSDSSSVDYKSAAEAAAARGAAGPHLAPTRQPLRDSGAGAALGADALATKPSAGAAEESGAAIPGAAAQPVLLPQVERITVERAGTQRWLVVQEPPEKLWPSSRNSGPTTASPSAWSCRKPA